MDHGGVSGGAGVSNFADKTSVLQNTLNNIFECLVDKDEMVRQTLQQSLIKIVENHPDDTIEAIVEYRNKHPKLSEQSVAILLRVIENSAALKLEMTESSYKKIISLAIAEMTKSNDYVPNIQSPAMEILASLGRKHCEMVIQELISTTKEGSVPHFMVMHCLGTLSLSNIFGTAPFIKTILTSILPNLGGIKHDIVKEAHAFAIGKFSETLLEYSTDKFEEEQCFDGPEDPSEIDRCSAELSVAYDVLFNQWLHTREQRVSNEILRALSYIYPLLPSEKIKDQSARLVPNILSLYRKSFDRIAITQFLVAVLKTNINLHPSTLDPIADALVTQLFDLICVYPDYEKPQTVKGHYEVLRCFDLLAEVYSSKILDMILMQLRNNGERERTKALLVLSHLTNTSAKHLNEKISSFLEIIKHMIHTEKTIKMRMTLLKTIVALAQKSFIKDKTFVWFMVRYSCRYTKMNSEHGTVEEHNEFVQSCQNSLYMLSSTVGTMDELLKRELLNFFILIDYTDITTTIMKCLASLFAKNPEIEYEIQSDEDETSDNKAGKIVVPPGESVLARCFALLGNFKELQRISNILTFLQFYYPHLNPELSKLWNKSIPELNLSNNREDNFYEHFYKFISETIEFLNKNDENFAERLVQQMSDQLHLYPIHIPQSEFVIPSLNHERGMLIKSMGLGTCYMDEIPTIESKIDLIILTAKQEKLDKHSPHSDYEAKILSSALALGFMSKTHLKVVLKKLNEMANLGGRKHSTGFFSNLHFMKDSHKEHEIYKTNLLIFISYGYVMEYSSTTESLKCIDDNLIGFLVHQLTDTKDLTMKTVILNTLVKICAQFLKAKKLEVVTEFRMRNDIIQAIFSIPIEAPFENLPLLPIILQLGTDLIKIENNDSFDGGVLFEIACKNFFAAAQNLKTKFDSLEEDEKNSFLAQYLNQSLPELNSLVKVIIELDPSPANLDLIISILESWTKDRNSETRICASHVLNKSLEVYIKAMKIGCEAPSKFNQTGQMLGKIIPRCIDSNANVRQISVEILQKTLEISCIYETLTIAGSEDEWIKELEKIKDFIITDDPKEIYKMAADLAKIIAARMSNFQYLQFCKTLLSGLNDHEQSSAIGASVVLKFFVQEKGSELFHAIPEIINDSLMAIKNLDISRARAKSGVLKSIVALTKHHPKLVCNEMLAQTLPYEDNVVEYWHTVCTNSELTGEILGNFLSILSASCLYEPNEGSGDRQKIASIQPFAIFCAMKEMFPCKEITEVLNQRFPDLFATLLTSLATYTNLAPPMLNQKASPSSGKSSSSSISSKSKYGFIPNKDAIRMNPCQIVLETFLAFLNNLGMEQISTVLTVCPQLSKSTDLKHFIELLTPMAVGIEKQLTIGSSAMRDTVNALSKYVSSPYEGQRIASIGLFSQLVPLKPYGDISSSIMFHLTSSLSDPNSIVRGLCIIGLSFVGSLNEQDCETFTEPAITALLKGIEDNNSDCLINIPLECMKGLSKMLHALPTDRVESFHVSLAIRIRPFFGSNSNEIREAAINLFGDVCESKMCVSDNDGSNTPNCSNEALREQLFYNFSSLILHLSETDPTIVRACKTTLRKVCILMHAPKVNEMAQRHLIDHGQLNYSVFIVDFVKLVGSELTDHTQDFIDSCIPMLKSQWPEIRGNSAVIIGILNNFLPARNHHTEAVGHKIAFLLKDENQTVRVKAAISLGYFFGDL